jgi:hypothetical protein
VKRVLPLLVVAVLALPAVSAGARRNPADGTLSVKDAVGTIVIRATGGFIGRFDRGTISIVDPIEDDGTGPIVSGAERVRYVTYDKTVYAGTNVRFRLVGGRFRAVIRGTGIDLSVVGRGMVVLDGRGIGPDGRYSFDGDPYASLPDFATPFPLGIVAPGP